MGIEDVIRASIEIDGYAIVEDVLADAEIEELLAVLDAQQEAATLNRKGTVFALRNLLDIPEVAALAESIAVRRLVGPVLGGDFFPVRGILFDKVPDANWKVPWHQDVTIAVQERVETEGFGSWSMKAGVLHVQPPASVLEKMISVRLHLDDCDEANGALRVLPGSHRCGRITEESIPALLSRAQERVCALSRGGALLMRPLLLHASSASLNPGHRRVIHVDFASERLPSGLKWLTEGEQLLKEAG